MRLVPFRGYNSPTFKRVLEEVWIYKALQRNRNNMSEDPSGLFLWLEDCFIYGVDADQQAIVLLYQQVKGSLVCAADYRLKAGQRWTSSERLKILRDVTKGCLELEQLKVVHRDVRASNLFYSERHKRYVLGGLACARSVKEMDQEDLLTVVGIETQRGGKLKELLGSKHNVKVVSFRWGFTCPGKAFTTN
jgi:serine/threonine protein kinase